MGAETRLERTARAVREMRRGDALKVTEILRGAPETVFWPEASVREVLGWSGVLALVFENAGALTGCLLGRQVREEAEILNLAVEKESRRNGHGTALLLAALLQLQARGVKKVFLEVRESNAAGIAFYNKHGFHLVLRRAGYYQRPEEAALVMERRFPE